MKTTEKAKSKKMQDINSEKQKIKNFIKAESLYVNQNKKLESIVREHGKADSPERDRRTTFNKPKQSQYTNFLPKYKISRGGESGFEHRTTNNRSPVYMMSEPMD